MPSGNTYLVNFGFTVPDNDPRDGVIIRSVHLGAAIGLWAVQGEYDPITFGLKEGTVQPGLTAWELTPGEVNKFTLYYKVPALGEPMLYVRGHIVGQEF